MLKAGVRVYEVGRYNNCHPSTKQLLRDRHQATGTVIYRRRSGQPRMKTDVKAATYVDIDDIRSSWLLSVPDE